MSVLTKKLHVHFDDDVASESTSKQTEEEEKVDEIYDGDVHQEEEEGETSRISTFNYTRQELLEYRDCVIAKKPPKIFDSDQIVDEKRKEKISFLRKSNNPVKRVIETKETPSTELLSFLPAFALDKYRRNGAETIYEGKEDVMKRDPSTIPRIPNDEERLGFQKLMAAASQNAGHYDNSDHDNRRRRVGSGRVGDGVQNSFWDKKSNGSSYGVDYRYSHNDFFDKRSDSKHSGNERGKFGRDFEWNKDRNMNRQSYQHSIDGPSNDTRHYSDKDSRHEEPEWLSCGPTSQHDIIELHGFDGPAEDDKPKENAANAEEASSTGNNTSNTNACSPPPARSTPTKLVESKDREEGEEETETTEGSKPNEEYFNFEDFLKMDFPSSSNGSREVENGESRFTRWFRRESPPKIPVVRPMMSPQEANPPNNFCSSDQFFELLQRSNIAKPANNLSNPSLKFRSVEELEADLCTNAHSKPLIVQNPNQNTTNQDLQAFKKLLTQMSGSKDAAINKPSTPVNIFEMINKNTQEVFQYQLAQKQALKRPEAQILLQRLANNEISQFNILQQLSNPSTTQRDRETLMAVFNFYNDNLRMQQQQQQLNKQKQLAIAQQLRLQMNMAAGGFPQRVPTAQELQFHTQSIMQNALLKKQLEEQYRKMQQKQQLQQGNPQMQPGLQQPGQPQVSYHPQQQQQVPPQPNQPSQSNSLFMQNQLPRPIQKIQQPQRFTPVQQPAFMQPLPQIKPIFGRPSGQPFPQNTLPMGAAFPPNMNPSAPSLQMLALGSAGLPQLPPNDIVAHKLTPIPTPIPLNEIPNNITLAEAMNVQQQAISTNQPHIEK